MTEEAFLDFPVPRHQVPVCTHVRSTLIGASVLAIKKHGVFENYASNLPHAHRDEILFAVAGHWLTIELAHIHYTACEAMGLERNAVAALGASVSTMAQKTMFSFVLKVATTSGVTPWTMLANGASHWARMYQGSAIAVFKLGPKECRIETVQNPLAAISYWRASFQGIVGALTDAFSTRAYIREIPWRASRPWVAEYRLSWV